MAGKPGYKLGKMPDGHRLKIALANKAKHIVDRMQAAFDGEIELTATQAKIGEMFLRKVIPDLKAVEHSGDADNPVTTRVIVTGVPRKGDK